MILNCHVPDVIQEHSEELQFLCLLLKAVSEKQDQAVGIALNLQMVNQTDISYYRKPK